MVMHHHEPECHTKRLLCYLQGQSHSEGSYDRNMTFCYIFWTADLFTTKLCPMAHHHKLNCLVKKLDCSVGVKVKVTGKVQNSSECSSGCYLLNCWSFFLTKLGVVIHHHEPECQVKRLLCCHQGQRHSEGSYFNRNMTFCYLLNYWTFCSQTLVWWHMIMSWLVSWKDCIAVLCSKSRSQQRLKISLNVHLDHIFSTRPWYNP